MHRLLYPLALLLLFWLFVSLRSQGDEATPGLASSATSAPALASASDQSTADLLVSSTKETQFGYLGNEYLAIFGIMFVSVVLALRKRAYLGTGRR